MSPPGLYGPSNARSRLTRTLNRYYRNLFTMAERIGIDGFQSNATLTAAQKAQLATLYEDFAAARHIDLTHPAVISATNLFEQLGLTAAGRAAHILANKPPA